MKHKNIEVTLNRCPVGHQDAMDVLWKQSMFDSYSVTFQSMSMPKMTEITQEAVVLDWWISSNFPLPTTQSLFNHGFVQAGIISKKLFIYSKVEFFFLQWIEWFTLILNSAK